MKCLPLIGRSNREAEVLPPKRATDYPPLGN
jgi:hypothetical protein